MAIPFLTDAVGLLTSNTVMFIAFELVLFLVTALFIWIGAKVADIDRASLARSFIIAILVAILTPIILIPFAGQALVSLVISVIVNLAIIKIIFATGWKRSLVAWVFSIIASIVSIIILSFVLILFL
jgi:hypothetical protein